MQTARQLCVASSACHGFAYHAANQTGTTFTTTYAATTTLQVHATAGLHQSCTAILVCGINFCLLCVCPVAAG